MANIYTFLSFLLVYQICQSMDISDSMEAKKCSQARNCGDCMGISQNCAWCFDPDYVDINEGPGHRCAPPVVLKERGCRQQMWEYTQSFIHSMGDYSVDKSDEQLTPSSQLVYLRPHNSTELNFFFKSVTDYPVDIYYLTDLSYSMKDDLATVSSQAQVISKTMKNLTKEFRIGFGAFVDKPVPPFVDPKPSALLNPCENLGRAGQEDCDPPFLYKHLLNLTSNIKEFEQKTKVTKPSGNLDTPEGGLDALLQVALCAREIGWQKKARKIVLFTTDGPFHTAGDGRLAGLIEPAPKTCQLSTKADKNDKNLLYMGWHDAIKTDYPSVGELAQALDERDMTVIFATSKSQVPLYESLAALLPSATVGEIQADSSNIVELLKKNYQKIVSSIILSVTPEMDEMEMKILSKCEGETQFSEKTTCNNHPLGGRIEYKVLIKPKFCFAGKKSVILSLFGMKESAKAMVEVKSNCECKLCQTQGVTQMTSSKCNKRGDLKCGVCHCHPGYSGDFCECDSAESASPQEMQQRCIQPGQKLICSNRGRCTCGKCVASKPRYIGKYLECDLEGCKPAQDDGKICGGPLRGVCNCNGTCTCKPGYSGDKCDCITNNEKCRDPTRNNGVLCSGQGNCDCGVCFCNRGWTGLLCNEPQGGQGLLCTNEQVKECILCLHGSDLNQQEPQCQQECNSTVVDTVKATMVHAYSTEDGKSNLCVIYDERECRVYFTYFYSDDAYMETKVIVQIQNSVECPTKANLWFIIGGVVGGIVGIGIILLLVWKLVVTIDDRRELAKFQKETQNAKWEMEENPIFKAPVTTVTNPMYSGID